MIKDKLRKKNSNNVEVLKELLEGLPLTYHKDIFDYFYEVLSKAIKISFTRSEIYRARTFFKPI